MVLAEMKMAGMVGENGDGREGLPTLDEWREFEGMQVRESQAILGGRVVEFRDSEGKGYDVVIVDGNRRDRKLGDVYVHPENVKYNSDYGQGLSLKMPELVENYLSKVRGYSTILDCDQTESGDVWFNVGDLEYRHQRPLVSGGGDY